MLSDRQDAYPTVARIGSIANAFNGLDALNISLSYKLFCKAVIKQQSLDL